MYVILLHHLLVLGIRPYYLSHVRETHLLGRLDGALLALSDDRAHLLVDLRVHLSYVLVAEPGPELVLVIKEGHFLPV